MESEKLIITIGRQVGSGGRLIGKLIAEQLGIAFYDREILQRAARESGIKDEFFERTDERNSLLSRIANYLSFDPMSPHSNCLSAESLFKFQSDAIVKAATEGGGVFVGRCSDYILRSMHPRTDVFITAESDDRVKRACEYYNIDDPDTARRKIEDVEKARAEYYNYFTDKTWGNAASYHLCVCSSGLTLEQSAEYIINFVKKRALTGR